MDSRKVFFESQQTEDSCRMHAINNALGKQLMTKKKFENNCRLFDQEYNTKGSREFFIVCEFNNILSFILDQYNIKNTYYPPGTINISELLDLHQSFIVFTSEHVWACRKIENKWFQFDSIAKAVVELKEKQLNRKFGYIVLN